MDFTVKLTLQNAKEFYRYAMLYRQRLLFPFLVILTGLLAVIYARQGGGKFDVRTFVYVLAGCLAAIGVLIVLQLHQIGRIAEKRCAEDPYFKYESRFTFSEDEIRYVNEISAVRIRARDIRKVRKTRNLYIAYFTKVNTLIFPADAIPPEFETWLRERLESRRRPARTSDSPPEPRT
jgi:hypothetical protein